MAVHLWFGRNLSVFLFVLLALAGTVRAGHILTHPAAAPPAAAVPQTTAATAQAATATRDAKALFQKGKEIKIKRDANVYITPGNIPKNDQFLKAYSADQAAKGSAASMTWRRALQ